MSKHSQTEDVKFIYDEYINKNIAKLSEESGYLESGDEMDATRKDGFYDGKFLYWIHSYLMKFYVIIM